MRKCRLTSPDGTARTVFVDEGNRVHGLDGVDCAVALCLLTQERDKRLSKYPDDEYTASLLGWHWEWL